MSEQRRKSSDFDGPAGGCEMLECVAKLSRHSINRAIFFGTGYQRYGPRPEVFRVFHSTKGLPHRDQRTPWIGRSLENRGAVGSLDGSDRESIEGLMNCDNGPLPSSWFWKIAKEVRAHFEVVDRIGALVKPEPLERFSHPLLHRGYVDSRLTPCASAAAALPPGGADVPRESSPAAPPGEA